MENAVHENHPFAPKDTTPIRPVVSARAEPRMISTMSTIAIPMPAPPTKGESHEMAISGGHTTPVSSSASTNQIIDIENYTN